MQTDTVPQAVEKKQSHCYCIQTQADTNARKHNMQKSSSVLFWWAQQQATIKKTTRWALTLKSICAVR